MTQFFLVKEPLGRDIGKTIYLMENAGKKRPLHETSSTATPVFRGSYMSADFSLIKSFSRNVPLNNFSPLLELSLNRQPTSQGLLLPESSILAAT